MKTAASSLLIGVALSVAVGGSAQSDRLGDVLRRATTYVGEYERQFSLLVAEEHYVQEESRHQAAASGGNLSQRNPGGGFVGGGRETRREIKSDYLIVRLPEGGMLPFRDVFEVDGRAIRDRQERLTGLFLQPGPSSFEQASRIMRESIRYNLGSVARSINIPTLALLFLSADVVDRFAFELAGEEVVAGRATQVVAYREVVRPTLIRTSSGRDLAVTGQTWIDPEDGVIVKTVMTATDPAVSATVTVTFRADSELGFWVPDQMSESYRQGSRAPEIRCTATYRNFRRFRVSTDEQIKRPPGPA